MDDEIGFYLLHFEMGIAGPYFNIARTLLAASETFRQQYIRCFKAHSRLVTLIRIKVRTLQKASRNSVRHGKKKYH